MTIDEVPAMTTSESDGATPRPEDTPGSAAAAAPKRARPRRVAASPGSPAGSPAASLAGESPAAAVAAGPQDGATGPDIDEDGAWIEADAVEVRQGAVGRVDASEISVMQGAIGGAKGERIDVHMGAIGAALGGTVSVTQGMAGTVLAQRARVEQSFIRTLVAQDVTIARPSAILFLVAQRVSGDVKVLLDWRGAIAFGAAFGILAGLFGLGRRRG